MSHAEPTSEEPARGAPEVAEPRPTVDDLLPALHDLPLPDVLKREAARQALDAGQPDAARNAAIAIGRSLLQPVLNATGVLLPRDLGGAPVAHLQGATYGNVGLDLLSGAPGGRTDHAALLFARAAGAADGLVLNGSTGALLLALSALGRAGSVAVARGELFDDGGGLRLTELIGEAGARLVEVGATNVVTVPDYRRATQPGGADLVLRAEWSAYGLHGRVQRPTVGDLAGLGDPPRPLVVLLPSGLLDAGCPGLDGGPPAWLAGEVGAAQALADGADLVILPGDRLLGGPQMGLVLGRADLVARCAAHPLARALRPGALVLDAAQQVALAHLGGGMGGLPLWRLAATPAEELRQRAAALGVGEVVDTVVPVGDDVLSGSTLRSAAIAVDGDHRATLRACVPPVIAATDGGRTLLDLRAVDPADDAAVGQAARLIVDAPG